MVVVTQQQGNGLIEGDRDALEDGFVDGVADALIVGPEDGSTDGWLGRRAHGLHTR